MKGARGKAVGGDSQGRDTGATALRVHTLRAIAEAEPSAWNACANPIWDSSSKIRQATPPATKADEPGAPTVSIPQTSDEESIFNPFISHTFLSALEDSGSVGGRSGWQPQHLLVKTAEGSLLGAA